VTAPAGRHGDGRAAAGVRIRALAGAADLRACVALQRLTWGEAFADVVPPALLLDVQRLGGVAAGAFVAAPDGGETLVGFVFGLPGLEDGIPLQWSDMLAVRPELRNLGIGERLKRWQRDAVLAAGVRLVRWSFEPLEARNARLNLSRLGATCREYATDLYGDMGSPLHAGIGTDRLVAGWRLDSERVRRRLQGEERGPRPDDIAGLPVINPPRPGGGCEPAAPELDAPGLLLAIPGDLQALKADAPGLAQEWRVRTRAAFQAYFARGYEAVELVRFEGWAAYVLVRGVASAPAAPDRPLAR
jgi:predicted GNAT superfamily acetyltransferase